MDAPVTITDQTPKEKPVVITSSKNKKDMFKFSIVNPKILGAMTVLLLLVGGVVGGVYLTQRPQQTTTQASLPTGVDLTFKPEEIETDQGSEFRVDIYADAHKNQITGTDLSIKYDPEVLTLKSITPGQFLPKILIPPEIATGSAFISLGTEGTSGVSGSGIIANMIFETNTDTQASSEITFDAGKTEIKVLNRNNDSATDTLGGVKVSIKTADETSETPSSVPPITENSESSASAINNDSKNPETTDFNKDGQTNSLDLSLLYSGWGNPKTAIQEQADLNHDGVINGMDFAAILPKLKR